MGRKRFVLLLLWPCAALLAAAQGEALAEEPPVWRCGNAYSHQSCEHGAPVDTQDGRTTEQQSQARAQAEHTRTFADTLHRENAAREARQRQEEIARQNALLKEQAARRRAQKKAQAAQDMAARHTQHHKQRQRRPMETRKVVKPLPNQTAPAPQR
ncbi:MAG: hypothetical protein PHO64_09775 [Thiomonas sp.]|nr:hypothetical protein [Thiomonas sp.]